MSTTRNDIRVTNRGETQVECGKFLWRSDSPVSSVLTFARRERQRASTPVLFFLFSDGRSGQPAIERIEYSSEPRACKKAGTRRLSLASVTIVRDTIGRVDSNLNVRQARLEIASASLVKREFRQLRRGKSSP